MLVIAVLARSVRTSVVHCQRVEQSVSCEVTVQGLLVTDRRAAVLTDDKARALRVEMHESLWDDPWGWIAQFERGTFVIAEHNGLYFDGRIFRDAVGAPARRGAWRTRHAEQAAYALLRDGTSDRFAMYPAGAARTHATVAVGRLCAAVLFFALALGLLLTRGSLILRVEAVPAERKLRVKRWPMGAMTEVVYTTDAPELFVSDDPSGRGRKSIILRDERQNHTIATNLSRATASAHELCRHITRALRTKVERQRATVTERVLLTALPLCSLLAMVLFCNSLRVLQSADTDGTLRYRAIHHQCTVGGFTLLPGGLTEWSADTDHRTVTVTTAQQVPVRVEVEIEPHRVTEITCDRVYDTAQNSRLGAYLVATPTGAVSVVGTEPTRSETNSVGQ